MSVFDKLEAAVGKARDDASEVVKTIKADVEHDAAAAKAIALADLVKESPAIEAAAEKALQFVVNAAIAAVEAHLA